MNGLSTSVTSGMGEIIGCGLWINFHIPTVISVIMTRKRSDNPRFVLRCGCMRVYSMSELGAG